MSLKAWLSKLGFVLFSLVPIGASADPFSNFYVIGDSLSDQGNLFQATLSLTGAGIPADDHYFMGRFSDGENYAGLLAERLGVTLAATSLGGTNYAYGGSRTAYNIVENPPSPGGFPPGLFPWTLNLQREAFVDRGVQDPDALYIVFSGSNDIADLIGPTVALGFEATKPISEQAVQGIRSVVEAFVAAGARDILVPNLPDMGRVPNVFGRDPLPGLPPDSTLVADTASALTVRFNDRLDEMLDEFDGRVNIIRFDTFAYASEIFDDPAAFGLTNSTTPCYTGFVDPAGPDDTVCDTPESYAFWDREHPTTVFHALVAQAMHAAIVSDLLGDLAGQVAGLGLPRGIGRALESMLAAATSRHDDADEADDAAVVGALRAFIRTVDAQRGKTIAQEDADGLVARARQLSELIEPSGGR